MAEAEAFFAGEEVGGEVGAQWDGIVVAVFYAGGVVVVVAFVFDLRLGGQASLERQELFVGGGRDGVVEAAAGAAEGELGAWVEEGGDALVDLGCEACECCRLGHRCGCLGGVVGGGMIVLGYIELWLW